AGNVARDRRVLVLAPDLVDFVDIDDAGLRPSHIAFRRLQQLQNDVLDVLTDVARLRQGGGIHDREWHIQHASQSLRQQRLAGSGRPDQQNVRFGQLYAIAGLLTIHEDALVVVIDRDRELLLGLLLADDVLVEKALYFLWLGKLVRSGGLRGGS